jgi:ADP-heptose:LPS heptosyltransferase
LRVLLVRAGALGDLLLLWPSIAALRGAGHDVLLVAPARAASVLVGPGAADAVLDFDGRELAALLAGSHAEGPLVQALAHADAVVAWTRSVPLRDALAARSRRLLVHDPAPPSGGPHAARWLARAIEPLVAGAEREVETTSPLTFTDEERADALRAIRELPTDFVAVHAGSGSPAKNWPAQRFVAAARALGSGLPWLLVRGPAERDVEPPADAVVARDWPLRRLGAALARAGLVLGNDSGVSHLAAAAGAPTLALFGPTDPGLWAPVGRHTAALSSPGGSLEALELEAVIAAGRALRSAASGPPSG